MSTRNRPKINPERVRHAHIDPSLTGDSAGFGIGHVCGYKDVRRRDRVSNNLIFERAPVIVVDFAIAIHPPVGDEIVLGDIRQLIYEFVDRGYKISMVTMGWPAPMPRPKQKASMPSTRGA